MKRFKKFLWIVVAVMCMILCFGACSNSADYGRGTENMSSSGSDSMFAQLADGMNTTSSMIIYTYDAVIYVDDVNAMVRHIQTTLASFTGAYVESSSSESWSYGTKVRYTLRVPTADLATFIDELHLSGEVEQEALRSQDITQYYVDLEAKKIAKEAEEQRLLALYGQATEISDINDISKRLADVQQELNQINATLLGYSNKVNFSTVNLTIYPNLPQEEPRSFGAMLSDAFTGSGSAFVEFFKYLLLAIVYLLPFLLVGAGVFCGLFFPLRIRKKKKAERLKKEHEEWQARQDAQMQAMQNPNQGEQ